MGVSGEVEKEKVKVEIRKKGTEKENIQEKDKKKEGKEERNIII